MLPCWAGSCTIARHGGSRWDAAFACHHGILAHRLFFSPLAVLLDLHAPPPLLLPLLLPGPDRAMSTTITAPQVDVPALAGSPPLTAPRLLECPDCGQMQVVPA